MLIRTRDWPTMGRGRTIRTIRSLIKQHPALYSRLLVRRSLVNQRHGSLCLRYFPPGSALYVYCILANSLPLKSGTHSNFNFTMDGIDAGTFLHSPDSSSDYQYNVPGELHHHMYPFTLLILEAVFAQSGLTNTQHTFMLNLVGGPGVDGSSLMLLDYFIYTCVSSPFF
jgi:hypothetical protein